MCVKECTSADCIYCIFGCEKIAYERTVPIDSRRYRKVGMWSVIVLCTRLKSVYLMNESGNYTIESPVNVITRMRLNIF